LLFFELEEDLLHLLSEEHGLIAFSYQLLAMIGESCGAIRVLGHERLLLSVTGHGAAAASA